MCTGRISGFARPPGQEPVPTGVAETECPATGPGKEEDHVGDVEDRVHAVLGAGEALPTRELVSLVYDELKVLADVPATS